MDAPGLTKGTRVVITGSRDEGVVGVIFWVGESKFGPGKRYGLKDDGGEIYWANESDIEALADHAGGTAEQKKTAKKTAKKRTAKKKTAKKKTTKKKTTKKKKAGAKKQTAKKTARLRLGARAALEARQ